MTSVAFGVSVTCAEAAVTTRTPEVVGGWTIGIRRERVDGSACLPVSAAFSSVGVGGRLSASSELGFSVASAGLATV